MQMATRLRSMLGYTAATLIGMVGSVIAADVYLEPAEFVAQSFGGTVPQAQRLWITKPIKGEVREIMGHDLGRLRIRYWREGERTVGHTGGHDVL